MARPPTWERVLLALLPQQLAGRLEYELRPERRESWGGPFNGQIGRKAIFEGLVAVQRPTLIVETGAFRGTTTAFLAGTGVPVVTVEGNPRYFGFAARQLRAFKNVELRSGDSRTELRRIRERVAAHAPGGTFGYLDAHWHEDLPLAEELQIVFEADREATVMIDDFQVPDDAGYGFDDYGGGRRLSLDYIGEACCRFGLTPLFPVLASTEETGAKRGCVVVASETRWAAPLCETGLLRRTEVERAA